MKKIKKYSFTLLELMLVSAVIMVLASMLLPALKKMQDKSKAIQCLNNLKQNGTGILMYCADYNETLYTMYSDGTWQFYWMEILGSQKTLNANGARLVTFPFLLQGYIGLDKNLNLAKCPVVAPESFSAPRSYGIARPQYDSPNLPVGTIQGNSFYLIPKKIRKPASFITMADAMASNLKQCSTFWYPSYNTGQLNMPHSNRTNAWFFDGHATACSEAIIIASSESEQFTTMPVSVYKRNVLVKIK